MVTAALDLGCRLVVAGAFAWAAVGKLADLPAWRATLYLSRLTRPWVPQLSVAVPAAELLLVAGLLGARVGWFAAVASALLLVAFTGYLLLDPAAAAGCHCFGGRTTTSRRAGVVRDLVLLAVLTFPLTRDRLTPDPVWGVPAVAEVPVGLVVLAGVAVGLAWAFRREARRPGRRSGRRSGRRRVGVEAAAPQPRRVDAAGFDVVAVDGSRLSLAGLSRAPDGVVLVFVEPGCALCAALASSAADRTDLVFLAAVDDAAEAVRWASEHDLAPSRVGIDLGGAVADAYRIPANPAACRVDARGILVDADGTPLARPVVGADAVSTLLAG